MDGTNKDPKHPPAPAPRDLLLGHVRALHSHGIAAVPLCAPTPGGACTASWHERPCAKAGKRPLVEGYPDFATLPPGEHLLRLLGKFYPCNLGLVIPDWMVVAEADSPLAETEITELSGGATALAPCRERRQDRGRGWLFRKPALEPFKNQIHAGTSGAVDLLGPGTIFVVPPSVHQTGHVYSWANGRAPWDVEVPFIPTGLHALAAVPSGERPPDVTEAEIVGFTPGLSPRVKFLMSARKRVSQLWSGIGGTQPDQSRSGYDYGLARELAVAGVPVKDIAEAIAVRPGAKRADAEYCITTARAASRGRR